MRLLLPLALASALGLPAAAFDSSCEGEALYSSSDVGLATQPSDVEEEEEEGGEALVSLLQVSHKHPKQLEGRGGGGSGDAAFSGTGQGQPSVGLPYRQVLTNFQNVQYFSNITVGNQTISMIMDTGSFEILLFSDACNSTGCGPAAKFTPGGPNYSNPITVQRKHFFGSGTTTSRLAMENFSINSSVPQLSHRQYFWEVIRANMHILQSSRGRFNGIFGLGPPGSARFYAYSRMNMAKSVRQNGTQGVLPVAKKQKRMTKKQNRMIANATAISNYTNSTQTFLEQVNSRYYSICLGNQTGTPGYLIWNDVPPPSTLFRHLTVSGMYTWGVQMTNLRLDHQGLTTSNNSVTLGCGGVSGCGVIIDSGTSLLVVTPSIYQQAFHTINQLRPSCNNLNTLPTLKFNLNGTTFALPPYAYLGRVNGTVPVGTSAAIHGMLETLKSSQPVACQLQLLMMQGFQPPTQFGPLLIFGMPFFREYYTTFDLGPNVSAIPAQHQRRIHLSRARSNCTAGSLPSSNVVSTEIGFDGDTSQQEDSSSSSVPFQPLEIDIGQVTVSEHLRRILEDSNDVTQITI